jgi:tetratricopeptide (TPR) repeat protein
MVKAWREDVVIPTYEVGKPDKNPMYFEKRVYQGSSGVVYPYPVIEKISDKPVDHTWHAIYLENEYIKVMVLPELGGRIQMAYDKVKQRHFVYYNHVIKPALVGLLGPWVSGGIEFNWPQHHRPSTYMPVDSTIEENPDGSVTVWVNEYERMFHQKGAAGFTLRPGKAYLEIKGHLYNATPLPQTFLWWANPAVAVNDYYQSVFPQDINAVFDHGKRAVSTFPIATGTYYKMDYSSGVDISNYRNIKVPTSYMGINSKYNFEGGYENDTHGGMLHVASHHVSPGKKQWTWGNGDFGRAWDRNLTDHDGPYIELMAGVFTENQPDFTWLAPYEEKRFTQYFMPYQEVGVVKNATRDLVFNIDRNTDGTVWFKLYSTSKQRVHVVLRNDDGSSYYDKEVELSPEHLLIEKSIDIQGTPLNQLSFQASVVDSRENPLTWHAEPDDIRPIPDPAEACLSPVDTKTNDQLYLSGLHLEQYRHATWNPLDYYEEALRRDPNDVRCLNQIGLWYLRRGRFEKAEEYLRRAKKVLFRRNPNPYDSEPLYNLALSLEYQGKMQEAYELFWKAAWSYAWRSAALYQAACISASEGRYADSLEEIESSLSCNVRNHKVLALKAIVLRLMGRKEEALRVCESSRELDPFNFGCRYEQYLLTSDSSVLDELTNIMHRQFNNYDELALDYLHAGQRETAISIWQLAINQGATTAMTYYYMGWAGKATAFKEGERADSSYCFPNRLEAILALRAAIAYNPDDARANYYLGCLYYGARQYDESRICWSRSAELDPKFPTVWRNLALEAFNREHNAERAVYCMERAFELNPADGRVLMELDQLYKRLGYDHEKRLANLEKYPELIAQRDDLLLEKITLLNLLGHYREAMQELDAHKFHPWEGGEGKVSAQYQFSRVALAMQALRRNNNDEAIDLLEQCLQYPHHLGEGKLYGAQESDFYYLLGCAHDAKGETDKARECWGKATLGPQEPAAAIYYNDAKPDKIFYQGLALLKLGREGEARGRFYKLLNYGKNHLFDTVEMDYFAVSLPDLQIWEGDLNRSNRVHCYYMLALGYCGLGDESHASRYLSEMSKLDSNHLGAFQFRAFLDQLKSQKEESD